MEMSSINAKRFVIPPQLSSSGFPLASRAAALFRRLMSIGCRSLATTRDPNMGDRGHPCVDPSSIIRVCQVLSVHLWYTVPGSS